MSAPSILRSAGTVPLASLTEVGKRSMLAGNGSHFLPGAILPGPPGDGRLALSAFIGASLAAAERPGDAAVFALRQPGAVVAREDYQRLLVEIQLSQRVEYPADAGIRLFHPVAVNAVA